jgi:hypothetical protein
MRKLSLILYVCFIVVLLGYGCATTNYVPSQCPQMEPPPTLHNVNWVMIKITDPDSGKVIVYYAIPASEVIKETLNIEIIKEFSLRAYELNK